MTVADVMEAALNELNEDTTTLTEVGWTPAYWDYSTFRSYVLKAIRRTAHDCNIQLRDVDLSATVFYDTEIDDMPAISGDVIMYRLYPTPTCAIDDSATEAYFYINSDTYEPKNFRYDGNPLEIHDIDYMDRYKEDWREDTGTPIIAVIQSIAQSSTGVTTPDHSADIEIDATVKAFGTYTLDSATVPLPDKLEDALTFATCTQALRKVGIEEDQSRAQLYEMRYREEIARNGIDELAGRIPTVKPVEGLM